MWFFLNKSRPAQPASDTGQVEHARRRPLRFAQMLEGIGDFQDMAVHDVALKFWLPEPVREALDDLARRQGESMSEMLRQFLAQHTYGVYAFMLMSERCPGIFKVGVADASLRFSRKSVSAEGLQRVATYWVPELGKNVTSIKLWLPQRLRADLQQLADHTAMPLSQYVREIVISRLLGHGTLPKRPEMLVAHPLASAQAWEAGEAVPLRQVEESEYQRHGDGELRVEWVSQTDADTASPP